MAGYPFPDREIEKVNNRFVMLPHGVNNISSYAQCENVMSDAAYFAAGRAQLTNNPRDLQYAEWFTQFGHSDRSVIKTQANGNEELQYWGGCKLLLTPESRRTMWPAARDELQQKLMRFHTSQYIGDTQSPTVACNAKAGGSVYCWKNYTQHTKDKSIQ